MSTADDVRALDAAGLRALLRDGHPIDPAALDGWAYRGTSLGLPGFVVKLSWLTFQKAFRVRPRDGALRGWNVRLQQLGLQARSEPMRTRDGTPKTFGYYAVVDARGRGVPHGYDKGLLIDYGLGENGALDPMSRMRDPLVAVNAGSSELLFGGSYAWVAGRAIDTPSFFVLEREHRIEHVPAHEQ